MKFQFDTIADFFLMSGHGPYVWACYLITIAVLLFLGLTPVMRQKRFIREQYRLQRLQQRSAESRTKSRANAMAKDLQR